MNTSNLYAKTAPLKLFFMVAIPGGISMLASSLWGLFEGIFVGQILGENAFAAMNLSFSIVFINFALADLIGVGSAVPISIHLGKNQEKEADNYFTCACMIIVMIAIVVGAFLFVAAPLLIRILGAKGEVAELAVNYMRVYALCSPFSSMAFATDNFLRICGKVKMGMALNILMAVSIPIMEYICLVVFDMGLSGSALAVSSCMFVCTLIALYPFWRKKLQLKFCKPKFSFNLLRQIVSSGAPTFLQNISVRVIAVILNMVLLRIGGVAAVNVYGILMFIGDFFQPILYGVCDALQPAIGFNWGAGNKKRVFQIEKCTISASAVISLCATLIMFLFPEQLVSLFLKSEEANLSNMAVPALQLLSLTYLTMWFGFAIQSFLVALDKPLPASILSLSNAFVFPLLLIVIMWPFGLNGIWLNFPITSALVSILAGVILIRMKKKLERDGVM